MAQLGELGRLPGVLRLVKLDLLDLEVDDDLRGLRRRLTLVVAAVAARLLRDARLEGSKDGERKTTLFLIDEENHKR